ncbi:zinc-finger domain-containing protein [Kiloniella laminariae]|uniref:Zinc-finger domain-containing protein n=1 Tax=Kiloniella laminariae TaxID=454162 RepID=A0ABT4LK72_9PROT|nr:zinc-finger domain-containing protein [Kiloniella laminariae]MCZ4281355.1 zinc-finger domain-containing protein [Kiloniella laminariae]
MAVNDSIVVETKVVACDGGKGGEGHPLVYLNMEGKNEITCPYCSKHFVLKEGASGDAGH